MKQVTDMLLWEPPKQNSNNSIASQADCFDSVTVD